MPNDPDDTELTTAPVSTIAAALADPKANPTPFTGSARYREQGMLGKGGMGEVRLITDGVIGRAVAVKTIAGKLAADSNIRERFMREARIQGQLEHPSIVPVYDLGVDEAGNDYFTMRRISGRTLASLLEALAQGDARTRAAFPRNALLGVFRQICLAVAYAHSRGVVHRDLKPANVMIGDYGEVYVLDWGIARLEGEPEAVDEEHLLGTPGYMAPEQVADASKVDERADVYSLGAILFEILALKSWHPRINTEAAIASTTLEEAARPASIAPDADIPPELDDLCAKATTRERDQRLASARELAEAIEDYLEGDRDLERRRTQARQRVEAARAARARVAKTSGNAATEARREALREAGRAVALDPDSRDGARLALELMLEPPAEIPADLAREVERAQSERIRAGILPGLVVFVVFLVILLGFPLLVGALDWTMPLLMGGALVIAIITSTRRLRRRDLARATGGALVTSTAVFFAIAISSTYLGPMIFVPALALATANALVASQLRWRITLALALASVAVPIVLEWAHVTPPNYHFGADGILITSHVLRLPEVPVRIAHLLVSVAILVGSVRYVQGIVRVENELRGKWLLQNWHLRQLAQVDD